MFAKGINEWVFGSSITYLGHVEKPGKLNIEDGAIELLKEVFLLRNNQELRSFLGLYNVYRRFFYSFVHNAPNDMPRKTSLEPFGNLLVEQLDFIKKLVQSLTSAPALHLLKPQQPFLDWRGCSESSNRLRIVSNNREDYTLSNRMF